VPGRVWSWPISTVAFPIRNRHLVLRVFPIVERVAYGEMWGLIKKKKQRQCKANVTNNLIFAFL
jgi:hypothetical protein